MKVISPQRLTDESFSPYGWLLGEGSRPPASASSFSNALTDFWQERLFDPGIGGEAELLRVHYRNSDPMVASLEMHRLCQQAVIPLNGEIIQVVASADLTTIAAFEIPVGQAVCMRVGCWHTTRVRAKREVKCLMLTRASTTLDLAAHLKSGSPLVESAIITVDAVIRF